MYRSACSVDGRMDHFSLNSQTTLACHSCNSNIAIIPVGAM